MYVKGSKVKFKKKRGREVLLHFAFSTCLFMPLQREGGVRTKNSELRLAGLALVKFTFVVLPHPAFYVLLSNTTHIPSHMSCLKFHTCVSVSGDSG